MRLPLRWSKISIRKVASKDALKIAKKAADKHPRGNLGIRFTEANPEWVLLYEHVMLGQIDPTDMKFMRRRDLKFLAGHTFPHPALIQPKPHRDVISDPETNLVSSIVSVPVWTFDNTEEKWDQVTKLQGNAARAKMELERRNFVWASVFAVTGAIIGGLLGGQLITLLISKL